MRPGERPSMVVTALPFTPETGIRQENMRSPSMCTMHAPHWPAPHPNLVPLSFSSSRSTHRRRVLSGALTLTGLPLTLKLIAISTPLCFGRRVGGGFGCASVTRPCYSLRKIAVNAALRRQRRACLSRPVWVSVDLTAPPATPVREGRTSKSIFVRGTNMTRMPSMLLLAAISLPTAATAAEYMEKTPFQLSRAFSPGVVTDGGKIVWVAGQTATRDNEGRDISNNFEAQVKQVFSQMDQIMKRAGGSLGAPGALAQPDNFDLVIKGGEVLDPGQKLRARRDVGIRNAVIAALEPDIPDARAKQTLDARGKLVLPG